MTVPEFMLYMCFARVLLLCSLIFWLIFRSTRDQRMRLACMVACLVMLASNLLNAGLAVSILKVSPW